MPPWWEGRVHQGPGAGCHCSRSVLLGGTGRRAKEEKERNASAKVFLRSRFWEDNTLYAPVQAVALLAAAVGLRSRDSLRGSRVGSWDPLGDLKERKRPKINFNAHNGQFKLRF